MIPIRAMIIASLPVAVLVGNPAGATKDFRDVPYLFQRVSEALESEMTGSTINWNNPETGNSGTIVITRTFYLADGAPCRDYTRTTAAPGEAPQSETGTGCREADGRWMLKEGPPPGSGPIKLVPPHAAEAPKIVTAPLPEPIVLSPPDPEPEEIVRTEPPQPVEVPVTNDTKSSSQSKAKPTPTITAATMPSRSE